MIYLDAIPGKTLIAKMAQPPEGYEYYGIYGNIIRFGNDGGKLTQIKLPYLLGERFRVRKPWSTHFTEDVHGNTIEVFNAGVAEETAYRWLTVTAVAVKQVKELKPKEIYESGIQYSTLCEFQS
jgi:hypothetical protein